MQHSTNHTIVLYLRFLLHLSMKHAVCVDSQKGKKKLRNSSKTDGFFCVCVCGSDKITIWGIMVTYTHNRFNLKRKTFV